MKKLNFRLASVLFAILVTISSNTYSQQNFWTLPPNKWKVTAAAPTITTLPGGSSSQYVNANGAYDQSGNLLFYVVDNGVYNANGSWLASLLPYYVQGTAVPPDGFGSQNENNFESIGQEIAIVPVPGTCRQFYIIYTMANGFAPRGYLLYMKIDCSGATPVLSSPTAGGTMPYRQINALNADNVLLTGGIAVSKLATGNQRYLFASGLNSIERFTITSTGIAGQTTIATSANEPTLLGQLHLANELDLSPDQQWLVWGNNSTGLLNLIKLNSSYTRISGASKTYLIPNIQGQEFNGTSDKVYVSTPSGIKYVGLSSTTVSAIPSSSSLNNTYLERAKNGTIYGVNNLGYLQGINEGTLSLYAQITSAVVYSNGTNNALQGTVTYRLNDQIDGESYDYFFGVNLPTADFKINGTVVPTACTTPMQLFNCTAFPMTMSNFSTNASQYKVDVLRSSTACGTYTLVHSTGIVSAFPTNLKNLPGGATGTYMATNSGYYRIILTSYNACQVFAQKSGYINVATSPTGATASFKTNAITQSGQTVTINACVVPQNTQFSYQDGATSCGGVGGYKFPMEHTSASTPNIVGRYGTTFDLSGVSAGLGSNAYTVSIKTDRWTGTAWSSMDSNPNGHTITGSITIPLASLLSYDALNPYYNAFTNPSLTPNGSIYRITIIVTNECGSLQSTQVIKLSTTQLLKVADPNTSADISQSYDALNPNLEENIFLIWPNPAYDVVRYRMPANRGDLKLKLYDMMGKLVSQSVVITGIDAMEGDLDMHTLPSATYYLKIYDQQGLSLKTMVIQKQ